MTADDAAFDPAQSTPLVEPVKRSSIIVRDLPRALAFWQDALGLTVWSEGEAGPDNPTFGRLLGLPPAHVRYVILQSGALALGMVGLFEVREPVPAEVRLADPRAVNRGEVVIVVHTRDIREVHRRADALGLPVLCPPQNLRIPAIGLDTWEMTLRDPDGVAVNLIEVVNPWPALRARPRSRFSSPSA